MRARWLIAAAVVACVAACADLTIDPAYNAIQAPILDPSFRNDIMPIFRQTCGSSSACHGGATPQVGLKLDDDSAAYATTVNVASGRVPLLRVKPGDADSSFLYLVLRDTASVRLFYYRMPLTRYQLPYPTRETIRNWINQGAKDN